MGPFEVITSLKIILISLLFRSPRFTVVRVIFILFENFDSEREKIINKGNWVCLNFNEVALSYSVFAAARSQ